MKKITPRGTGRPDYSNKVNDIIRGKVIKEWTLLPNQKYKFFSLTFTDGITSLFPHVISTPLASGETASLIDEETGIPMPFTVPAGYDFKVLKYWASTNEPYEGYLYFDGQLVSTLNFVDFDVYFEQEVALFKLSDLDPELASEHTVEIKVKNMGAGGLRGMSMCIAILEKVHTKEITEKECKCPFCGNIQKEPLTASRITCSNCGKIYWVRALPFGGR